MLNLIKNQRGNTALIAIMGLAIAGGVLTLSQQSKKVQKVSKEVMKRSEGEIIVDKMRALSSFLVANNVIICKQGLFKEYEKFLVNSDPSSESYESDNAQVFKEYGSRCKWTGQQITNGVSESLNLSNVKFSNERYFGFDEQGQVIEKFRKHKDFGALVYDVDTVALFKGQNSDGVNQENIEPVRGKISFKLYDFSAGNDTLGIAERIGVESLSQTVADGDHFAVLIKAEATYNRIFKQNDSGEKEIKKDEVIERYFAIRRPLAMPRIEINQAVCKSGCDSSLSINNNPECRGSQAFDNIGEVKLTGTLYNPGPGTIYALAVEKNIKYDKKLHPNKVDPDAQSIDLLGDKDYLLPGESVEWVDSIVCETFKTTVNQTIRCSNWRVNAAGNPMCWDSDGNVVDPVEDASSDSSISQHREPSGQVTYKLEAGSDDLIKNPIGTLTANIDRYPIYYDGRLLDRDGIDRIEREMIAYVDEGGDSSRFFRTRLERLRVPIGAELVRPRRLRPVGDEANNGENPEQIETAKEWKSMSNIEPKRLITTISVEEGVPQKKETTVNIQIIPTH